MELQNDNMYLRNKVLFLSDWYIVRGFLTVEVLVLGNEAVLLIDKWEYCIPLFFSFSEFFFYTKNLDSNTCEDSFKKKDGN